MRLLADESCDFAVVRALRSDGHDVAAVAEMDPRADDKTVIGLAMRERRVLLTEDKDFGQLVFAFGSETAGVILLRFPAGRRQDLPASVLALVRDKAPQLAGAFVVLQPGRVRLVPGSSK